MSIDDPGMKRASIYNIFCYVVVLRIDVGSNSNGKLIFPRT